MFKKTLLIGLMAFSACAHADVKVQSQKPTQQAAVPSLDIPKEKRQKIEQITNEHNTELQAARTEIRARRKALKAKLTEDKLDLQTLQALNKDLFAAKEQEQLVRIKYQVALSNILTAEQRQALNQAGKKRRQANFKRKAN